MTPELTQAERTVLMLNPEADGWYGLLFIGGTSARVLVERARQRGWIKGSMPKGRDEDAPEK